MNTIRLNHDMICPTCRKGQDCLGEIGQVGEGDIGDKEHIAICSYCGAINVVTKDLQLRSISKAELIQIMETSHDGFMMMMNASFLARHFPKENN